MKFKISATIPTGQYANILPEIEVEAPTYELAQTEALDKLEHIWKQYGVVPLVKATNGRELLTAFVGGEIYYEDASHVYTNKEGDVYLSGSQYAKQFEKPFDGAGISAKMATKYKTYDQDILDMWELKARTSREFGTALHSALQLYGQYNGLAKSLERETHLHDHPVIKSVVESFYKGRESEKAEYEILIVDHENKRAGQVDRLLVTGDKECQVQDFKFNAVMTPDKLSVYWKQLDFYGEIMQVAGWKTLPPQIFHYDGKWKEYQHDNK